MWDLHTTTDMRLLLLVCLLTWPEITSADETGFVTVAEGDDAVLPCSLSSKENIEQMIFDWKKDGDDQKQVFYYVKGSHYNNGRSGQDEQFKGRVSHFQHELQFGNASIKIRNTELADNGSYTCIFPDKQKSHITLYVDAELKERHVPGAAPKPDVTSLDGREDYALLQCKVQGVPKPTVEWKDSVGNVLPAKEPEIKESEGRFYITLQIIVTNSDNFTCVATQEKIHHRINGTISVYVHGAASEPSVRILNVTKEGALLLCVVRGASPKPDVIWQDSTGKIIPSQKPQITERGGSYNILLLTTVTKTDYYRCTVTQKDLKQVSAETLVQINEISTGWIIGVVVPCALLSLVMVAGVVVALLFAKGHFIVKLKPGEISNLDSAPLNYNSSSGQITHQNP